MDTIRNTNKFTACESFKMIAQGAGYEHFQFLERRRVDFADMHSPRAVESKLVRKHMLKLWDNRGLAMDEERGTTLFLNTKSDRRA